MAFTLKVEGIEEISKILSSLEDAAPEVAALALYDGAGVMADAYAQAALSIKSEKFNYRFGNLKRLPSHEEKAAVIGTTGVAKFHKNGSEVETSIGISGAGYVEIAGRKVAVLKIANAINSGTSFMTKQPVFRRAATKTREAASAAIQKKGNEIINGIIDGLKVENGMVYVPTVGKKMSVSQYKKLFKK